jgi:hypothetical protein
VIFAGGLTIVLLEDVSGLIKLGTVFVKLGTGAHKVWHCPQHKAWYWATFVLSDISVAGAENIKVDENHSGRAITNR